MNFIQLDPASLSIGYVCGTLLCWYLRDMLDAKESEYDKERETEEKDRKNHDMGIYGWNHNSSNSTPNGV